MAQATNDTGILAHASDLIAIIGPLVSIIGGLVIYAWKGMMKRQDKLAEEQEDMQDEFDKHLNDMRHDISSLDRHHNNLNQRLSLLAKEHEIYCSNCPHIKPSEKE